MPCEANNCALSWPCMIAPKTFHSPLKVKLTSMPILVNGLPLPATPDRSGRSRIDHRRGLAICAEDPDSIPRHDAVAAERLRDVTVKFTFRPPVPQGVLVGNRPTAPRTSWWPARSTNSEGTLPSTAFS